jgi:formylglycine-generating enzyme required for sulfatase activity
LGALGHHVGSGAVEVREKPVWASEAGQDQYGRYADLVVKGITQKFRWIEPGRFWMGSPASEPDRCDAEIRYQVTLTKGFWLADTACTQCLWTAVLDNNPAHFTGDANNPVEQVSWEDTHMFMQKLNAQISELNARLPNAAEWEYACRAGTNTPFSFGNNITPEQVNYDGNYPYANGKKGLYRQKTVPVKSLPANAWDLYEMHGNVCEWCQDAWSVTDPEGGGGDMGQRVLRGGSWFSDSRDCRSAYCFIYGSAERLDFFGFRLALGM